MARFLTLFVALLAALFAIEMLQPVQRHVVLPWTALLADASGWLMRLFDDEVAVSGKVIASTVKPFGVSIEPGCNGVEAMIVLLAAIMAFPSSFKAKLWGLGLGFLAVQSVNLLRIVSLFFLGQWNFKVFEFAHLYMWQALIMLDVLVVWLLWMRYVAKHDPKPAVTNAAAAA